MYVLYPFWFFWKEEYFIYGEEWEIVWMVLFKNIYETLDRCLKSHLEAKLFDLYGLFDAIVRRKQQDMGLLAGCSWIHNFQGVDVHWACDTLVVEVLDVPSTNLFCSFMWSGWWKDTDEKKLFVLHTVYLLGAPRSEIFIWKIKLSYNVKACYFHLWWYLFVKKTPSPHLFFLLDVWLNYEWFALISLYLFIWWYYLISALFLFKKLFQGKFRYIYVLLVFDYVMNCAFCRECLLCAECLIRKASQSCFALAMTTLFVSMICHREYSIWLFVQSEFQSSLSIS